VRGSSNDVALLGSTGRLQNKKPRSKENASSASGERGRLLGGEKNSPAPVFLIAKKEVYSARKGPREKFNINGRK